PPARRAPVRAVERAGGGRGRARTPWIGQPRATGADGGGVARGAHPGRGGDVVARARNRHGGGRSGGAGGGAGLRRVGAAARGPRRGPGGGDESRRVLPEVPR